MEFLFTLLVKVVAFLIALLPTRGLMAIGSVMGWIWYRVVPVRVKAAREAIAASFPEKPAGERERILRTNLTHLCRSLLEAFALVGYPEARLRRLVSFEGLDEAVQASRARGHGAVVLSAHVGSFELDMGAYALFSKIPVVIIARLPTAGFARAMLAAVRAKTGIEALKPRGSLPRVVQRLTQEKALLGFVIDQNMPRHIGVFVEFLGRWCSATPGFSAIARRSGAEVIPGWNERQADGTQIGRFGPAVSLDPHPNLKVAMLNDTFAMTQACEKWVRTRPDQWFWVHRRWKTQPNAGDVVRTSRGLEIAGESGKSAGRVAAFLDRDGTILVERGRAAAAPEEVELVSGAAEGIRALNGAGLPVIVVTNQALVARGVIDETQLSKIHERMTALLAEQGAKVDAIFYCPHHPTEGKGAYLLDCDCRKPRTGLFTRAAKEHGLNLPRSFVVGDRATDVAAARAIGTRGFVVTNGWSHAPWEPCDADERHDSLPKAADAFFETLLGSRLSRPKKAGPKTAAEEDDAEAEVA